MQYRIINIEREMLHAESRKTIYFGGQKAKGQGKESQKMLTAWVFVLLWVLAVSSFNTVCSPSRWIWCARLYFGVSSDTLEKHEQLPRLVSVGVKLAVYSELIQAGLIVRTFCDSWICFFTGWMSISLNCVEALKEKWNKNKLDMSQLWWLQRNGRRFCTTLACHVILRWIVRSLSPLTPGRIWLAFVWEAGQWRKMLNFYRVGHVEPKVTESMSTLRGTHCRSTQAFLFVDATFCSGDMWCRVQKSRKKVKHLMFLRPKFGGGHPKFLGGICKSINQSINQNEFI